MAHLCVGYILSVFNSAEVVRSTGWVKKVSRFAVIDISEG